MIVPPLGVSTLPGVAFGDLGGDHIRISYACSKDTLREGVRRIREVVESLGPEGGTGRPGASAVDPDPARR